MSGGGPIDSFHRDNTKAFDPFGQRLLSNQEIRSLDALSQAVGINGEILMESAAQGVYRWFLNELVLTISPSVKTSYRNTLNEIKKQTEVMILCGPGNNGGDGLALGRIFSLEGWKTTIFLCDNRSNGLFPFQKKMLDALEINTYFFQESKALALIPHSFCIFDCILGTGQRLPLGLDLKEPVDFLTNISNKKGIKGFSVPFLVALDTPTGNYKADNTLCLGAWNVDLYAPGRRQYCGIISRIPLPFVPIRNIHEFNGSIGVFVDYNHTLRNFGKPDAHSYKNQRGSIGVVGGSAQYPGAPILTLEAAAKSGAGLLYFGSAHQLLSRFDTDIESKNEPENESYLFDSTEYQIHLTKIPNPTYIPISSAKILSVLVIGPGWNSNQLAPINTNFSVYEQLLFRIFSPFDSEKKEIDPQSFLSPFIIVDAGALRILARSAQLQELLGTQRTISAYEVILTPHYGELKELLSGFSLETEPETSEISSIQALAKGLRSWVIVKFNSTLIVDPNGRLKVLDQPCSILGFGGSGDILAGILATQLAKVTKNPNAANPVEPQQSDYYDQIWEALERAIVLHNYVGKICEVKLGFVTPQEYLSQLGIISVNGLGEIPL